jgi:hypothetical protein
MARAVGEPIIAGGLAILATVLVRVAPALLPLRGCNSRDHFRDHGRGLLARTCKDLATFRRLVSPSVS